MASRQVSKQSFRQLRTGQHEGQIRSGHVIEPSQPWMLIGGRGGL